VPDADVLDPEGNPTLRIDGAGMHQVLLPLPKADVAYNVVAHYKTSSDYGGTSGPLLIVKGMVNEGDKEIPAILNTEWYTVAALCTDQTEDGFCCAQIYSRDTGSGSTWIGRLEVVVAD